MYQFLFVHLSLDELFGCFHVVAMVILLQCSFAALCISISVFRGYRPRSVPSGSYGISMFTVKRQLRSVFIRGTYQLKSHLKLSVYISSKPLHHFCLYFFADGHSDYCELIPFCGWICICLVIPYMELIAMYFFFFFCFLKSEYSLPIQMVS